MNDTQIEKAKAPKTKTVAWNPPVEWVKEQIEKAGTTIGSVHFKKRENGELRKMSYRLHVKKPSVAKPPKGVDKVTNSVATTKEICSCGRERGIGKDQCSTGPFTVVKTFTPAPAVINTANTAKVDKKAIDKANNQMTVLDANKVVRDQQGAIIGRGAWRTIPLENVVRIACKGDEYFINRY